MAVTYTKYTGSGDVASADYKYAKWVGKTKGGSAVTIELTKVICLSNIDLQFADKGEVVPEIEFSAVYDDTALAAGTRTEPWTISIGSDVSAGSGEILLGAGAFYIGTTAQTATMVALTRGGGSFTVERKYREINADGDPGPVEGRITKDEARPKLKLKALTWLSKMSTIYSGLQAVNGGGSQVSP